ncbi:MAG: P1 family peptidase [Ruminococcaceae bacterium]|nr:P1 family peptidase [Oscillospiraceae bacterium]
MKEIKITEIENIRIGNAEDAQKGTGVTVIICEKGAQAGLDIRGGGPASRESGLLNPLAAADRIHAVVLSGGSAFGLGSADGVMQYLKEKGIGFETGIVPVPLVCTSCIFDLGIGEKDDFPDKAMGYMACENAQKGNYKDGNYGAGQGASVGKLMGEPFAMKSGIGSYAVELGNLKVGAVVVVNALGDIVDERGNIIAGLLSDDKNSFRNSEKALYEMCMQKENLFTSNTTIGAVITNAALDKTKMNKVAQMAHNGMARAVCPVHTSADGDSIYALSVGKVEASTDVVGTLAARVMQKAIINAVKNAQNQYGLKCAGEIK